MKYLSKALMLLLAILYWTCKEEVSSSLSESYEKSLDSIVLKHQAALEVPGIAIGVMLDNEVVYAKGFGVQDLKTKMPLTQQSLFHMASVSKPFVATAIMQLVETGKMVLDSTIVHYLPYFKMDDERYKDITIRHVLSHRTGIPDVQDYEWDKPQYDDQAAEGYVKSLANQKLEFTPGSDFSYCNTSFDIMADVIAKVSGMTFEAYIKRHIFEPIGMRNSTFIKPEVPEKLATRPHIFNKDLEMGVSDIYPYNRIHAPSSTLHSNVEDMLLWAQTYFNKGSINNQQIFKAATYDSLLTTQIDFEEGSGVCLSWFTGEVEGKKIFRHSGGDLGYRTFFGFIPEEGFAIVTMGNNEIFNSSALADEIINKLLFDKADKTAIRSIHFHLRKHLLKEGIDQYKAMYFQEKENNPEAYRFKGGDLDRLGYLLLEQGHYQKAVDLFKFNTELEPEHAGWHDSVGDAYRAWGKKDQAIEWYKKALVIKPDQEFTKRKLIKVEIEMLGQHYQQHQDYESLNQVVNLIPLEADTAYVRSILGVPIDMGFDFRYLIDSVGANNCVIGAVFHIDENGKIDQKWIDEICE